MSEGADAFAFATAAVLQNLMINLRKGGFLSDDALREIFASSEDMLKGAPNAGSLENDAVEFIETMRMGLLSDS